MISAQLTTQAFSSIASICLPSNTPRITAGKKAMRRLRMKRSATGSRVTSPLAAPQKVDQ